jgi:hypothetical protein
VTLYHPGFPFRFDGADMKSAPNTQIIISTALPAEFAGCRFIPQNAYVHLRAMSGGALTTSPGLRVGTNGTHDNVCPIFIPPTSLFVGQIGTFPLKVPLVAPPVDTTDLILEITQSAVGPTVMLADVLLVGLLVG